MIDRNQLKTQGIQFARLLQLVFRTASVFSTSHATVQAPLQQSYQRLNELVKANRQFTIGFVDDRVLINNILTSERTLQSLENEFLKRGIGAITFEAGITLVAYKHLLGILSAPMKEFELHGGLEAYLLANPIEFARAYPATKNQKRTDSGDTILDMDSESFLMAKAINELRDPSVDRIDLFMRQATMAPGADTDEDASGEVGSGIGSVPAGGPKGIGSLVENYFNTQAMASDTSPNNRSYLELARIIRDTRPEFVLEQFSPQRREELRKLPPDQMAAEVIEDSAVKWAAERLVSAPAGGQGVIVEEEVIRVLLRSLQTTQMASRLARKLAEHLKSLQIPPSTCTRIQEELEWVVVPQREKFSRLKSIQHYSRLEFRLLVGVLTDLAKAGEVANASELATHYFAILDAPEPPRPGELGRAPELIKVIAGLRSDFWQKTLTRLGTALSRWSDHAFLHQQIVNSIDAVCKTLALYEDFELIDGAGKQLELLVAENPADHSRCCGNALPGLLTQSAIDRVIELYKQRKDDHAWMRLTISLLKRAGIPGITRAFQHLEDESSTPVRMALLRLIGRLGPAALKLARERIGDERWYVVRNACKLLLDLKDPELLTYVAPALRHADQRVQKAAVSAILDSRLPGRAGVLAAALPSYHPQILEDVLSELMFLRDPVSIPGLEHVIFVQSRGAKVSLLCVQIIASIPGSGAELILLRVVSDASLDVSVRRAAIAPLLRSQLSSIQQALTAFVSTNPTDPLAVEIRRATAASGKA